MRILCDQNCPTYVNVLADAGSVTVATVRMIDDYGS